MRHELKTIQPFYKQVANGNKMFELRKNDRNFQIGDTLILMEYDPSTGWYTGRNVKVIVMNMIENSNGIEDGYCIMYILLDSRLITNNDAERTKEIVLELWRAQNDQNI